jgi:ribosomal protein S18 acetylase RimI-like enzyme
MFYIAYLDHKPAGVCLFVLTDGVAGIYAVATLPEFRKKGVATTLMKRGIHDAREKGCQTITLQVSTGSYAESLYRKLGFDVRFIARILECEAQ